jgi:penicillin-binding protein 2B
VNIAPSDEDEVSSVQNVIELEDYQGESPEEVSDFLTEEGLKVTVIGEGDEIIRQSHSEGTEVIHGEKVILLTDDESPLVPDLSNWSARNVYLLGEVTGIRIDVSGVGFVQKQRPSPGSDMSNLNRMIVELSLEDEEISEEEEVDDSELYGEEEEEEFFMD